MADEVKIQDFAAKVERICDFVIAKLRNDGVSGDSADARVLLDLKEEAADIATGKTKITEEMFTGLADYMKGA
jgi:hypothetical protein